MFRSKYRLAESFSFAWEGMLHGLATQRNLRIHFLAAFGALTLCLTLHVSKLEMVLVFLSIALVVAAELINTAVEAVVDLVTRDYHPLAKAAKDSAAAAVLVSAVLAGIVGFFVFFDKLFPAIRWRDWQQNDMTFYAALLTLGLLLLALTSWRAYVRYKNLGGGPQ